MDLDAHMRAVFKQLPNVLINELGQERALELAEREPERLRQAIREAVREATEKGGQALAEALKRDGPAMLARRRAEGRRFEERLAWRWARPFDLAEMAMVVAYEAGASFNETYSRQAEADDDLIFVVLVRLHARACRIAEEVLVLLKAGFGQGALARWRALHEVSVVTSFLSERDQDTAERYLLHENIEAWRAINEMNPKAHRLNVDPYTDEELSTAKELADHLVERYGTKYAGHYGWAHAALVAEDPKYEKENATLSLIEKVVRLDHLRPYYRMASHGTHANPKGILFTPDVLDSEPQVLLAGPGSTGFADPGQFALISLTQVTASLLMYKGGESAPLVLTALMQLTDEAGKAYADTQRAVENSEDPPRYGAVTRLRYRMAPRLAVERERMRGLLSGHRRR